ncbi:nucleotidyltransferase domain-containing protein [Nostocaceae cyanobacterium CENA369]|uniref:Nucleotidyltransferase domain-containing protein n=1 Tax=Dendronalium phyllosphericum CENA369 TaxID=1725256 RepID=A0A8J7HYS2_9NOST|nr:nucleotidyltransferase domain-containing protein [Dendronalium phyllosphericum]MBH8572760.1 nucleotidyltransferase domain-containing protein [Dendronalium phyllosphericum CENA369]
MKNNMPIPEPQRSFLEKMLMKLQTDERLLGVAIAGSYLRGEMDEYSDLDLIIVVNDAHYQNVLQERQIFAGQFDSLLAAFTGEHVGEPRVLICLYDNPLVHVDLKFLLLQDFTIDRVEDPAVLWEQKNLLTLAIANNPCHYPPIDLQWIEDRFWVWIHYCAARLGRGELFEALDFLAFLRGQVLAPLAKVEAGRLPRGVRNLEREIPQRLGDFYQTIPTKHNQHEIAQAIQNSIHFYRQLRDALKLPTLVVRTQAEVASTQYLQRVIDNF